VTYDAFGRTAEVSSGSEYNPWVYFPNGNVALYFDDATLHSYLPLPGGATLYINGSSGNYVWHNDWLGSARLGETLVNSTVLFDRAFAAFGEEYQSYGNAGQVSFTGDTQNIVAGTYDTPYREMNPNQGRWISPDPSGLGAVNLTNPQTWNRYAYVANNPLISVDPKGLSIEGLLGDLFHKDNLTFQDCTVDGLSSPCSMAMMIAASPALQSLSYSCDGFGCGQISVDPDTGNYQTVVGWKSANIYSGRDENGDAMFNEGLAPSWEDIPDPTIAGGPQTMAASIGPGGKHFSRKRYSRGRNFRKAAAAIYS